MFSRVVQIQCSSQWLPGKVVEDCPVTSELPLPSRPLRSGRYKMDLSAAVSGQRKMVISELSSGAWMHIAAFLDGYDLVQMFRSGNLALIARLRSGIDTLCVRSCRAHSVSVSALLRSFRGLSQHPRKLSLSFKAASRLQLSEEVDYAEIWSHLPTTLRELSLAFPSHSPHLRSLEVAQRLPYLEVLKLSELPKTATLELPSTLISLQIGTFEWGEECLDADLLLPALPSGLRSLKVGPRLYCRDASSINLRRVSLEVLHAEFILLYACPKSAVSWSFLPSSLYELSIDILIGSERTNAQAPSGRESWASLFPHLSALTAPLPYLLSDHHKLEGDTTMIATTFPESLTSISLLNSSRGSSSHFDIALVFGLIARSIGPRLLRLNGILSGLSAAQHLPHLPNWQNPRISLPTSAVATHDEELNLARSTNPCHLLSTRTDSLSMGLLLPEAVRNLPRSLISLEFTMPRAATFDSSVLLSDWPPALTSLSMTTSLGGSPMNFDSLPKTLVSLRYRAYRSLETIGGLQHLSRLESLSLQHGSDCSPLFRRPTALPSSLTHLHTDQLVLDNSFFSTEFSTHLERLTVLKMKAHPYSINIIPSLPRNLTSLEFRCHGREEWTSKLLAALPRSIVRLHSTGALKWSMGMRGSDLLLLPPNLTSLNFGVRLGAHGLPVDFAEYLPLSLAYLYGPTAEIQARWSQRQEEALDARRKRTQLRQFERARDLLIRAKAHSETQIGGSEEYQWGIRLDKVFSFRNPIISSDMAVMPIDDFNDTRTRSFKRSISDPAHKSAKMSEDETPQVLPPPAPHWAVIQLSSKVVHSPSAPKMRPRHRTLLASLRAAPGRKTCNILRQANLNIYLPSSPESGRHSKRQAVTATK